MRSMPKTMDWLRKNNGIAFGRYHITGFHSEDNQIPLFAGVKLGTKLNKSMFLSSKAKALGYITQYSSTANMIAKGTQTAGFDYWNQKPGLKVPDKSGFCMGNMASSEVAFQATMNFFNAYPGDSKFTYMYFEENHWWKPVSVAGEWANTLDSSMSNFLTKLPELDKTSIYVLSDHGSLFWEQRSIDPVVSREHKLPLAVVRLSPQFTNTARLHSNKWKLLTPYDMHELIVSTMGGEARTKFGYNILKQQVPDARNCDDAGIPPLYCLCGKGVDTKPPQAVVIEAMKYINTRGHKRDPNHCKKLEFVKFKEKTTRFFVAPNEFTYQYEFETTFGLVYEAVVYTGKGETIVQSINQWTTWGPAVVCSSVLNKDKRAAGKSPIAFQYCGCEKAFPSKPS